MSLANAKGGFNVTLRVTQNSSNESMCVLQKPLLKKTGNWSLQVTDLFINKTPPVNRELGEQFRIFAYEGRSTGFKASDYIFTPKNCFTVMEYVGQLQEFFNKFSFLFWQYGVTNPKGVSAAQIDDFITGPNIITSGVNYTKHNLVPDPLAAAGTIIDEGYGSLPKICVCSLDSDLKLRITMQPIFLANFYIVCEDHFIRKLGLPKYMFQLDFFEDLEIRTVTPPTALFNFDADVIDWVIRDGSLSPPFVENIGQRVVSTESTVFFSDFTVRELDERVSIDLVSTFPVSRKIHVIDGIEQHEYLLARFDLANLKQFESVTFQDDDNMYTSTQITETYEAGIENLTRGNADYESNILLPGSLQQIHLMLYTRYLENNKFERQKTDMEDGFWHCRILFSKKI